MNRQNPSTRPPAHHNYSSIQDHQPSYPPEYLAPSPQNNENAPLTAPGSNIRYIEVRVAPASRRAQDFYCENGAY